MRSTEPTLLEPLRDKAQIQAALMQGKRLVACLCAAWCTACASWRPLFAELAAERPDDCFVWIDIEDHAELVAEIEVETLPVLLVQVATSGPDFVGAIEPRTAIVRALLRRAEPQDSSEDDPGVRSALLGHAPDR